ncbi:tRNA-splicing endonuclease subunit Sen34 [Aplochiton taeniatus]
MGRAAVMPAENVGEHDKVNPELVEQYQAELESSYDQQKVMALEDRKTVMLRVMTEKLKGDARSEDTEKTLRDRVDALTDGFSFACSAMTVQLHTARLGLAHSPEEHGFLKADWPRPLDESSKARFCVFRDLRRQGFYLTSAGKFGGDYLVYPGDPLRFHAHFIAVCVSMNESMPPCDILATARLGSNVKKTVLLCSPVEEEEDPQTQRVVYTSLQWSGMA